MNDPGAFWFNACEAGLWLLLAVLVLSRRDPIVSWWRFNFPVGLNLLVFSFSDVVESQSGAWWTPWWQTPRRPVC